MEPIFWIWMAAALIFLIIELSSPTLIFVCFVVGSITAGIYSTFQPDEYYWQIGICLAVSLALLPLSRKFAHRITKAQPQNANVDRMIGHTAVVTKAIDPDQPGQIRYEGEVWLANASESFAEGTKVKIVSLSGTRVRVERLS
jgi:membrane protein implicated in regulation of membrane protease activity